MNDMEERIRGRELVDRYKAWYRIPEECVVTEEMALRHWELERRLTEELLASTPENRWEVFERCYNTLFTELEWLNEIVDAGAAERIAEFFPDWLLLIGRPPKKVYEVGSGKARLILFLAEQGFECRATEITRERGEKWAATHPNLTWGASDGVHLGEFEPPNSYDVVISDQVIEHMHPDDVLDHFRGVLTILVNGGRYIFSVPHVSVGPTDVSRVFGYDKPKGMHLKEYTYGEIAKLAKQAGFKRVQAAMRFPRRLSRLLRREVKPKPSALYLIHLRIVEKLIMAMPTQELRRRAARAAKLIGFRPTSKIIGVKG